MSYSTGVYRQVSQPLRELPPQLQQMQLDQRLLIQQQSIKGRKIEERPQFQEMQGGAPPSKSFLGDDTYLVIFLLTVENDRLKEENTNLTSYITTNELKFKGVDLVEQELIQLRNKLGEYEKKLVQTQNECEQWKAKYLNKEKESEDQRYQQELQRRIQIDREIRELTARFISDRNQLEGENRQLRSELDQLKLQQSSIEDVQRQIKLTEQDNKRLRLELENLRKGFDELEYVLKTAADLEEENLYLKQQIDLLHQQQQQQQQQPRMIQNNQLQFSSVNLNLESENKRLKDEVDRLKLMMNLGQTVKPQPFM